MGPAFVGAGFASGKVLTMIIEGKFPGMPKVKMAMVDVREVA